MSTEVKLKGVRLSHSQLWKATEFVSNGVPDGKPKFRSVFLMEKGSDNLKAIKAAMLKEATAMWNDKASAVLKSITGNPNKCGLQDGDSKVDKEGYAGMAYIGSSNKAKPTVKDRDGKTDLLPSDGRPYDGCYVNAIVECFASKNTGNGVYFALKGVMFAKDGDSFGGGAPLPEDAFQDMADTGGDEAPASAGGDDFGA